MPQLISNAFGLLSFASPLFLLPCAWRRFYRSRQAEALSRWRNTMAWLAILSATALFLVSLWAFLTIPCNVDKLGWSCVVKWNLFAKYVLLSVPALICLMPFGRKGTRIPTTLLVLAVAYDRVLVSAMA